MKYAQAWEQLGSELEEQIQSLTETRIKATDFTEKNRISFGEYCLEWVRGKMEEMEEVWE